MSPLYTRYLCKITLEKFISEFHAQLMGTSQYGRGMHISLYFIGSYNVV